jgi:hypothetical protein
MKASHPPEIEAAVTWLSVLPRFSVRQGSTRGLMVWDREKRGPAMFNGQPAIGLNECQADEIKTQLVKYHAAPTWK